MTDRSSTAERRELLRYASDGPWEVDSSYNADGSFGSGPDPDTGYDDYVIIDSKGQVLFGSENSDAKLIEVEYDDEGGADAWDQVARRDAALIVAAVNDYARHLDMEEVLAEVLRLIRVPEDGSDQSYLTAAMERARSLLTGDQLHGK